MFRRLFENNDFKREFAERVEDLCSEAFQYENTVPYLNEIKDEILYEIPYQAFRFGYPESCDFWYWSIYLVDEFLRHRVESYLQQYDTYVPSKPFDFQSNTDDFIIYPNPTEDDVNIMMLDGRSRVTSFTVCDVMGRLVENGIGYLSACEPLVIGQELPSGVYVVRIGEISHRFVKY
jgi:hypothetical protein